MQRVRTNYVTTLKIEELAERHESFTRQKWQQPRFL